MTTGRFSTPRAFSSSGRACPSWAFARRRRKALRKAEELRPDVALVDIMLAGESGFELARNLVEHVSDGGPAVILISTHAEADFGDLIAESPATGFLPKSELSADAIRLILDGRSG
jgi:DNA-binding NarL/FixJ family response regulator